MLRRSLLFSVAVFVLMTVACNRPTSETPTLVAHPYAGGDPGSVGFDITPVKRVNGTTAWLATYSSQGKKAKFRIEFGPSKAADVKQAGDLSFLFGEGRFVAEPDSDGSVLLSDLKEALEARAIPTRAQRAASIQFTFVNLGSSLSQARGAGFSALPPGDWTVLKIFLGQGDTESEVFLNLNPVIKKGQFSIKDADYGDLVIAELAKVL